MNKIIDYCSYHRYEFGSGHVCRLSKKECKYCNKCIEYLDATYINDMNKYDVNLVRKIKLMKINKHE